MVRNVRTIPTPPVVLAAGVAKDLLPNAEKGIAEVTGRFLFNAGPGNVYYNIGTDCDNVTNFNGYIVPGQQLDVSNTNERVSGFTTTNATVAVTIQKTDNYVAENNFIGGVIQAV